MLQYLTFVLMLAAPQVVMTADQYMARWEWEIDERDRPLTEEELDTINPKESYSIIPEPPVRRRR